MNTKRTLIVSTCIMVLILIVTVVGVSAAWFGDILNDTFGDNEIVISSEQPTGQTQIDASSAGMYKDSDTLTPAKTVDGYLLGGGDPASITNVLDASNANLQSTASQVKIIFPFSYLGAGDSGEADGKKAIEVKLTGAYLYDASANPIKSVNYMEDFTISFDIVKDVTITTTDGVNEISGGTDVASTPIESLKKGDGNIYYEDTQNYTSYMLVEPGVTYYCRITVHFNKVAEELNPALMDTNIQLAIQIDVATRKTA